MSGGPRGGAEQEEREEPEERRSKRTKRREGGAGGENEEQEERRSAEQEEREEPEERRNKRTKRRKTQAAAPGEGAPEAQAGPLRTGDLLYVNLPAGLLVPYEGWFEADVVSVAPEEEAAVLQWSSERVYNAGRTKVSLRTLHWVPAAAGPALGPAAGGCPRAWLARAAASVGSGAEDASAKVFFARWWAEARWGLARFCATPPAVLRRLEAQEEARRAVAGRYDDADFWDGLGLSVGQAQK